MKLQKFVKNQNDEWKEMKEIKDSDVIGNERWRVIDEMTNENRWME